MGTSPGWVFTLLALVALVVFQADGMPVGMETQAEFNRDIAPFMGADGKPFISLQNMRQRLHVSKDGYNPSFDRERKRENYLQFGDLGDSIKPDPLRAKDPDKELEDLEYQLRSTFLVQQHSVRRMVKMKRRMDALLQAVQGTPPVSARLGEDGGMDGGVLSSHEIRHVLTWKPESPKAHTDTFPSFRSAEATKSEDANGKGLDLGEGDAALQKFLDRGLKSGVLNIKRGLYEELESAKDLDGNAQELANMVAKVTQHVSRIQEQHVSELGPSYYLSSKIRNAHHHSDAAKVGRVQLRKLAGIDKFNQFMVSENKFAEKRLKTMISSLKLCSKALGRERKQDKLSTETIEALSRAGKHLTGLLKRQAHVAQQALRKCDGLKAYVTKMHAQLDKHELTPKEAGLLP